jgi:hypothetical protein
VKSTDSIKSKLLYGRSLRFVDSSICGAVLGVVAYILFESGLCAYQLPAIPLGFIVITLVPLLFIKLVMPVFMDVLEPRRRDVTFVVGISQKKRIEWGSGELAKVNRWLIILITAASGIDIVCNGAFKNGTPILWILGLAVLSVIESHAFSLGASFLLKRRFFHSSRKDSTGLKATGFSQKLGSFFISITWALAGVIVAPLGKRSKAIARRQATDIFRGDPMSSIILPLGAIAISVLFAVVLRDSPKWVIHMIFVFIAYGIVLFNDEALQEASGKFSSLLNYRFSIRDFFIANCYLIFLLTGPIIIAFLFFGIFFKQGILDTIGLVQFLITYFYLVVAAGCRYSLSPMPQRDVMSAYFTYGYPIVALPSLGIPIFGFVFPVALVALLLSMERDVVKKTPFQRACMADG